MSEIEKVRFPVENTELPVYVAGMGFENIQKGIQRENGWNHYQWIQSYKGSGVLTYKGEKFEISEGMGFLLPPNVSHAYYPDGIWIQDWIAFNGNAVSNYIDAFNLNETLVCSRKDSIRNLICQAIKEKNTVLLSKYVIEILYEISKQNKFNKKILTVIEYMEDNFSGNITIEDLAKEINITSQHLCRLFKKQVGMRPFEYLAEIRIGKSKEIMISDSRIKIEGIAKQCGYSNANYFCKVFKDRTGMTPKEFKDRFII